MSVTFWQSLKLRSRLLHCIKLFKIRITFISLWNTHQMAHLGSWYQVNSKRWESIHLRSLSTQPCLWKWSWTHKRNRRFAWSWTIVYTTQRRYVWRNTSRRFKGCKNCWRQLWDYCWCFKCVDTRKCKSYNRRDCTRTYQGRLASRGRGKLHTEDT